MSKDYKHNYNNHKWRGYSNITHSEKNMNIKVNSLLKKTIKPPDIDLAYKRGVIIQTLNDGSGLNLVDFGFLQWYVHETDFHLDY